MNHFTSQKRRPFHAILFITIIAILVTGCAAESLESIPYGDMELRDGKLFVDGQWVFLKTAKALRNYASEKGADSVIKALPILKEKNYNCIELPCYWHHFDKNGDGKLDKPPKHLNRLISEIRKQGMYVCLGVEIYGVGGGQVPKDFFKKYPDSLAVNYKGETIIDHEYGFNTAVPSILSEDFRRVTRDYIKDLASQIDTDMILYFETTVEPQYMGAENLCYSTHAKKAYEKWLTETNIKGPAFPSTFPVTEEFMNDPVWNRFRAEALADWVNGDAAAYREIAGPDALVAVDYLETAGGDMINRNGDSLTFLRNLTSANIIQVNWHWSINTRSPNLTAYENVRKVMKETGRDWAISEHMTFNGSDYTPQEAPAILRNTIKQGTRFGWDLVNVAASTKDAFVLYNNDWTPKPLIAVLDNNWADWLAEIQAEEKKQNQQPK